MCALGACAIWYWYCDASHRRLASSLFFSSLLFNFLTDELPLPMSQVVVESALCALSLRLTRAIREQFQISLPILKVYACKISNWLHQFISYFAHHTPRRHRGGGGGGRCAQCVVRLPLILIWNCCKQWHQHRCIAAPAKQHPNRNPIFGEPIDKCKIYSWMWWRCVMLGRGHVRQW